MGKWIIENYQWLIIVVIAIIAILVQICIARRQNKKEKQGSQNGAKLKFFVDVKKHFEEIMSVNYLSKSQLKQLIQDGRKPLLDEFELSKAEYLFGDKVFQLIKSLTQKSDSISSKNKCLHDLYYYLTTRKVLPPDLKEDFIEVVNGVKSGNPIYNEDSLRSISGMCVQRNIKICNNTPRDYDYFELFSEVKTLESEFKTEFISLKKQMEEHLKQ